MTLSADTILYHATSIDNLDSIREHGLRPGAYLGSRRMALYYAETVEDDGDEPEIIAIPYAAIAHLDLVPDQIGIDEPLTSTLGLHEEAVWSTWEASTGTASACYDLIETLRCMDPIPAADILFDCDADVPSFG